MTTPRTLRNFPLFVIGLAFALAATFGAGIAWADPPTRIARLSYFTGSVSFSPAGDDQWAHAVLNRPVITGDRLWSDNGGRVELTLDNGSLWLGAATSVVVSNIDDRTTQFELQQGTLDLRVRREFAGNVVEIDTPNLALQVTRAGRYRIEVDPQAARRQSSFATVPPKSTSSARPTSSRAARDTASTALTCRTANSSRHAAWTNSSASCSSATHASSA